MTRYLSVCSGIEAASVAWHPLGWEPFAFSEIEAFPSAVLAHRFPNTPNLGDMTKFQEWSNADVDVLVGGTPCQSFSVAGLRKGLADPRGNLALTYLAIADKYRPEWLLWENVPGVLSSGGGRDFGAFLGGLGQLGYGFAYRVLDAQYVRVDGFGRAVPQRRRRVFVVGHSDWRRAAAVLFDAASLYGDSAPRREAGERTARHAGERAAFGGGNCSGAIDAAACLTAKGQRIDYEVETFIAQSTVWSVTQDSTPVSLEGCSPALKVGTGLEMGQPPAIAWAINSHAGAADGDQTNRSHASGGPVGLGIQEGAAYTLRSGRTQAVAFAQNTRDEVRLFGGDGQTVGALAAEPGMKQTTYVAQQAAVFSAGGLSTFNDAQGVAGSIRAHGGDVSHGSENLVASQWAVRRLTPLECERLQGFPDGWTDIPYRGKPAADGPRYKALGNSMACNVMRWIGRRIEMVRAIDQVQRKSVA